MESAIRRVKVFICRDNGKWEDQGTGYLYFGFLETVGAYCFRVRSEGEPQKIILDCVANKADIYERQQETLLVWCEPRTEDELALSFAEKEGCDWFKGQLDNFRTGDEPLTNDFLDKEIMKQLSLCIPLDDPYNQDYDENDREDDFDDERGERGGEFEERDDGEGFCLPEIKSENIGELVEVVLDMSKKDEFISAVLMESGPEGNRFFNDLVLLFKTSEEQQDLDTLYNLFHLMKNLILLNEPALLDLVFQDDIVLGVFSILEYDPEYRMSHRKHLSRKELFREIIPVKDKELAQKIHQTYKIQYMKEVALARMMDDPTFATLKSMLTRNQSIIVTSLQKDSEFFDTLFAQLRDEDTTLERRKSLLLLVQELFTMASRCLFHQERIDFYKDIEDQRLWESFNTSFSSSDPEIVFLTANVLSIVMSHNASLLRQWMFHQNDMENSIIYKVADLLADRERLIEVGDASLVVALFDILRLFVDPESALNALEKESLYQAVYPYIMDRLRTPFDSLSFDSLSVSDIPETIACQLVQTCELLNYCLEGHGHSLRTFALRSQIFVSIFKIFECRVNHVIIAGIRLLRTLISKQDTFYDKHIINYHLLQPIVNILLRTGDRYNVLNSAIVEMFEFIRTEKREKLRKHIASAYTNDLKDITYVSTFHSLLFPSSHSHEEMVSSRDDSFDVSDLLGEKSEEDYFNEDSDEEDKKREDSDEESNEEYRESQREGREREEEDREREGEGEEEGFWSFSSFVRSRQSSSFEDDDDLQSFVKAKKQKKIVFNTGGLGGGGGKGGGSSSGSSGYDSSSKEEDEKMENGEEEDEQMENGEESGGKEGGENGKQAQKGGMEKKREREGEGEMGGEGLSSPPHKRLRTTTS